MNSEHIQHPRVAAGRLGLSDIWGLIKTTASLWNKHNAMRMAASLAFYSVLSLAPLILLSVALTGLLVGVSTAQQQVLVQFRDLLGPEGEQAVRSMFQDAKNLHATSVASIVGLVTLLFSASQVFAELQSALNEIWEVDASRTSGIIAMIRARFFSFGLVLAIGLLLLVSLLVSAVLAAADKWASGALPMPGWMLQGFAFLVSLAVIAALFALIFRYIPDAKTVWESVWIGAAVTACLFDIGKTAIGLYLGKAGIDATYGTAGSLVAVVIWVYYSALIFFFGAEFTHVLCLRRSHAAPAEASSSKPGRPGRPGAPAIQGAAGHAAPQS